MGESESGAKVDDEENGLADHQYSRKLFLKTRPLRGLLSFPPRCRSPPSSMSSTKLSLKAPPQIQMIIHCHVPSVLLLGGGGATPLTSSHPAS